MIITKAVEADYIHILRAMQNKHIEYISMQQIRIDIYNSCMYKCVDNGKIIAILSVVWDKTYNYYAIKRLCILQKKNRGKDITELFIDYIIGKYSGKIGCTPWVDNSAMRHILEKKGFVLEYIFSEKWCFYSRS